MEERKVFQRPFISCTFSLFITFLRELQSLLKVLLSRQAKHPPYRLAPLPEDVNEVNASHVATVKLLPQASNIKL